MFSAGFLQIDQINGQKSSVIILFQIIPLIRSNEKQIIMGPASFHLCDAYDIIYFRHGALWEDSGNPESFSDMNYNDACIWDAGVFVKPDWNRTGVR